MDKIINFIIQAILGGASGYITNDYAINMLFKEYTPLKIGGVIKKTRAEFIDNLSSLVENDIINKDKLKEILLNENFNEKFENLTKDFYTSSLYEVVGETKFSNIDGIDSTIDNTGVFLNKIIDEQIIILFLDLLFKNLNVEEFLSHKQLDYISNKLYESIVDMIENTDVTSELFSPLYENLKGTKIKDLISKDSDETINKISTNISDSISAGIKSEYLDSIIDIFTYANKNSFLNTKELILNKEIKNIINLDEEFKVKLIYDLKQFLNSENGQSILKYFTNNIFSQLYKSKYTLFEIIDNSFEMNLKQYLDDNLPKIADSLVEWVKINSKDIDYLIDSSIDEVIKESDGFKRKLLLTLKDTYFNNIGEKLNISDKIAEYIVQITETDKLSNVILAKIKEVLNNITLGQLINNLKANNILTPEIAVNNINIYLNTYSETLFNKFFDYFLSFKVKDVIPSNLELNLKDIIKKSNIISDKNINNVLSKLLDNDIENLFNKNISKDSKLFLNLIKNNSDNIKTFINNSIKKIDINNLNGRIDLNKASQLLNKIYYDNATKLKELEISTALDKLNKIDNLYKNSVISVRDYTISNLDSILEGSVKGIVTSNLNKLNDDELVKFANDFIGRNLHPIMFFGAALGTIAGILLAIFQNPPPALTTITAANMITYAFVGYLTNVIAIKMIFKPYKENKFLSKIPFFRHFSLGYIVKNQKVFAENTAYFVDNKLLTKESINELFDKYEENIKSSFTRSISENDYNILNQIIIKNKNILVYNAFKYTKNSIYSNTQLSNYFYGRLKDITIPSLLSNANINNLSRKSSIWIKSKHYNMTKLIEDKISSKNSISDDLSHDLINSIKSSSLNYEDKYNDIYLFLDEIDMKIYANKYNNKFRTWSSKPVSEILTSKTLDNITLNTSKKITKIILSQDTVQLISNAVSNNINKMTIENEKTLSEIFNGKIKDYLDNKSPEIYNYLISSLKKIIHGQKGAVTLNVQREIKNHLGTLEKGMYSLMNGDAIIDKLMGKIITVKVPEYIDSKKNELENIYLSSLYKFYNTKANNIVSSLNNSYINNIVGDFFDNEDNKDFISEKINIIALQLENKIRESNLNDLLSFLYLSDLTVFYEKYEKEINNLCIDLSNGMKSNKEEILSKLNKLSINIIDEFFKSTSFNDLFKDVSLEEIECTVINFIKIIDKDDQIEKSIHKIIENYKSYSQSNKVVNFIDKEEFVKSAEEYINNVVMSDEVEDLIKKIYSSILDKAVSLNLNFVDGDVKSYLLNIFVDSSIQSIRNNLNDMLKSIELDTIAKEEIKKMEPEKIHNLFNSFAGKYITRLKLYGFGGFIFGVNTYVGLSLTGLKVISEIKNKNKKDK